MIADILRLTRWELFKLRRRWMPWILLFIGLAVVQAFLWGFYSAYHNIDDPSAGGYPGRQGAESIVKITCADILDGTADAKVERVSDEFREHARRRIEDRRQSGECPEVIEEVAERRSSHSEYFVLPGGLSNSLGVAHQIGVLLVMILGASAMGVEYGYGTLRTTLARGVGRWQFLSAKALSMVLLAGVGLIIASLSVVISSLIAASLVSDEIGGVTGAGEWSTVGIMFGKALYGLVPYAVLALFVTVLTSSSSMGIAISLAYYVVESIVVLVMSGFFDWFGNVSEFLLGPNIAAWMTESRVVTTGSDSGLLAGVGDLPGTLHAFITLLVYTAVLGAAATWLFLRGDITGASGE